MPATVSQPPRSGDTAPEPPRPVQGQESANAAEHGAMFTAPKVGDLLDVQCHTSDRQLVRAVVRADSVTRDGSGCWVVTAQRPGGGDFSTVEVHVASPGRLCVHEGQYAPDGTPGFIGFAVDGAAA